MRCWERPSIGSNSLSNNLRVASRDMLTHLPDRASPRRIWFSVDTVCCLENGSLLAESNRFEFQIQLIIKDIDLQRLRFERAQNSSSMLKLPRAFRAVEATLPEADTSVDPLLREVLPLPFVPGAGSQREQHCEELFPSRPPDLLRE